VFKALMLSIKFLIQIRRTKNLLEEGKEESMKIFLFPHYAIQG